MPRKFYKILLFFACSHTPYNVNSSIFRTPRHEEHLAEWSSLPLIVPRQQEEISRNGLKDGTPRVVCFLQWAPSPTSHHLSIKSSKCHKVRVPLMITFPKLHQSATTGLQGLSRFNHVLYKIGVITFKTNPNDLEISHSNFLKYMHQVSYFIGKVVILGLRY